jgi:hypothetical protein
MNPLTKEQEERIKTYHGHPYLDLIVEHVFGKSLRQMEEEAMVKAWDGMPYILNEVREFINIEETYRENAMILIKEGMNLVCLEYLETQGLPLELEFELNIPYESTLIVFEQKFAKRYPLLGMTSREFLKKIYTEDPIIEYIRTHVIPSMENEST